MNQFQVEVRIQTHGGLSPLEGEVIPGTGQIIWRENPIFITNQNCQRVFGMLVGGNKLLVKTLEQ